MPPLGAIGTGCETQGLRETMTLLSGLLGGCQGQALGGSRTKTFSPVGYSWLPIWLSPVTAKGANNQGEKVHMSNSTTPIVLILVSGDS